MVREASPGIRLFCGLQRGGEPTFSSCWEGFRGKTGGRFREDLAFFECVLGAGRVNRHVSCVPLQGARRATSGRFFPD